MPPVSPPISDALSWAQSQLGSIQKLEVEVLAQLWSGYGQILRLRSGSGDSWVLKWVSPPATRDHPRGWGGDLGHQRKLRSYQVEETYYQAATKSPGGPRQAKLLASFGEGSRRGFLFEDLDAAGFPRRIPWGGAKEREIRACLDWLARFHAHWLDVAPQGLWERGSYWHLATRPEEHRAMPEGALKQGAQAIDRDLAEAPHRTWIHGDAKIANFCFSGDGGQVAGLDFQYVGGGIGVQDVVYFLVSALPEEVLAARCEELLEVYFGELRDQLGDRESELDPQAVLDSWRPRVPSAWADYLRFLEGWAPGHSRGHPYVRAQAKRALDRLDPAPSPRE